jgi:hypothetical protein
MIDGGHHDNVRERGDRSNEDVAQRLTFWFVLCLSLCGSLSYFDFNPLEAWLGVGLLRL